MSTPRRTFKTERFGRAIIHTDQYANGGLAVQLLCVGDGHFMEPLAMLSVWVDRTPSLPDRCFFVKDWSENQLIIHDAADSGWFKRRPDIKPVITGFELAEVWELLDMPEKGFSLEE